MVQIALLFLMLSFHLIPYSSSTPMTRPFELHDDYFLRAKREGYRARSAYKLRDIQHKFKLINKGDTVVDLGAAPGSFMQVILKLVGDEGKVVGFDLQEMEPFDDARARTFVMDIFEGENVLAHLKALGIGEGSGLVDVVTSDLAPKTTGIKGMDQARSAELTDQAAYLSRKLLKPGGHFVGKFFDGEDAPWLIRRVKKHFKKVKVFKPVSCRDRSLEKYIVAMGLKK
jgi:23S rRNA (uridine2552-2'-O)-methyltransferase